MVVLSLLHSPELLSSVTKAIWLLYPLSVANALMIVYCGYRLIKNKEEAIHCMERMPNWMERLMDRMPDWTHRWVNHTSMRVMMIGMDVMLALMCVQFGMDVYMGKGA
jgi:hypothetical protein